MIFHLVVKCESNALIEEEYIIRNHLFVMHQVVGVLRKLNSLIVDVHTLIYNENEKALQTKDCSIPDCWLWTCIGDYCASVKYLFFA